MAMADLKKLEIRCSTRLSKVELQARATLAVPEDHKMLISPILKCQCLEYQSRPVLF